MTTLIIRRIAHMIPLLIVISMISFVLINLPPGDFLTIKIQELEARGDTAARRTIEQWRERFGLDLPLYQQYLIWVNSFLRGDFGRSFEFERDVRELIGQRLALSVTISLCTMLFTWLIAIPAGIFAATRQYSFWDQSLSFISFIGMSMPNFLLALILMYVSVVHFGWGVGGLFSPQYVDAPWSLAKFVDLLRHLWVPVVVIGIAGTAGLMRIMRGNLLDILGQQYIETARSKGLKESLVVYKHAVRVAINPIITIAGMMFPAIIAGEVITSVVMNLPTIGPLFLRALLVQDMYLAGSILIFLTLFLLIGNLLADIALGLVDPRIRYED
ncbi:MAG: ABC transporter permease [Truepera sp.]|nr:ABC transporter permease [Truepera sp.]